MRTVKDPEERKGEILDIAESLFTQKGYGKTTIMDILKETGIAKGTFYYYFNSKEEVLDAIIDRVLDVDEARAEEIAGDPEIPVLEKFFQVLMSQHPSNREEKVKIMEDAHEPQNAEMHQKMLVKSISRMAPIMTKVVNQGIREDIMHTAYPKETVALLIASAQTIFDKGLFHWEAAESERYAKAFVLMMEASLGTEKDSFHFMLDILNQERQ